MLDLGNWVEFPISNYADKLSTSAKLQTGRTQFEHHKASWGMNHPLIYLPHKKNQMLV
jgi:hypothetical protein